MAESDREPLACPRCAKRYPLEERFCASCGMPLTYAGAVDAEAAVSDQQERARKIRPEYSRGELRRVTTASQQAEAEFIQMLLLEEGIPSTLRRSTWDVPELLAAGPRAVLVPESAVDAANEILRQSELASTALTSSSSPSPRILFIGLAIAIAIVAALVWLASSTI
jgi:Putative prokaryotic signal transducing protein